MTTTALDALSEGWLVAAALVLAGLLFLHTNWSAACRRAIGAALSALRGVLPPLAVVLIVGAWSTPKPILQVAVGAAIGVIAAHWVYSNEWGGSFDARGFRSWGITGAVTGGVILGVVLLLVSLPNYDDSGGIPSAFGIAAFLALGLALVARLIGYAWGDSRWRIVTVVLAAVVILRALLAIGVLGVKHSATDAPSLKLSVGVLGVVFVISVIAEGYATRSDVQRKSTSPTLPAALGLGLAAASAVGLLVALAWGGAEITAASSKSTKGLRHAGSAVDSYSEWSDRALALGFLPVLRFDGRARWTPELVDGYVERAMIGDPDKPDDPPTRDATPDDLISRCPSAHADPCKALTIGCPRATNDDSTPCSAERTPREPEAPRQDGGVYVRVARKGQVVKGDPNPFESFGPPGLSEPLRIIVQYWLFYDYDEWVAPVLGGRIVQRHEGDWEAITVGLAADHPLFVGFSEHCGGVWQRWPRQIRLSDTTASGFPSDVDVSVDPTYKEAEENGGPQSWDEARKVPTHTTVQVAVGSQANYPPRLSNRAPDWSTCRGIPREAVSLVSYVSNIRDRTGSDLTWMPKTIALVNRVTPPMTFPGTWGSKDSMQYVTTVDDAKAPGGRGPATPSRQDLWLRPVFQIFCSDGWRADGDGRDPSCRT